MRKKLLFSLTLVLAITLIASGTVYAVTHQAVKGAKLVGIAMCGRNPVPTESTTNIFFTNYVDTQIKVTNPNCGKSISITYLAILDQDGNIVHEGTPTQWNENGWVGTDNPVPEMLGPHGIWQCAIVYLIGIPGGPEVSGDTFPLFTVEFTYSGTTDRPLIGTLMSHSISVFFRGFDNTRPWLEQVDSVQQVACESNMESFAR